MSCPPSRVGRCENMLRQRQDGLQKLTCQLSSMVAHVDEDSWTVSTELLVVDIELTKMTCNDTEEDGKSSKTGEKVDNRN